MVWPRQRAEPGAREVTAPPPTGCTKRSQRLVTHSFEISRHETPRIARNRRRGRIGCPALVKAETQRVLRFIPQADVTAFDPVYLTRNHAYLVFDTLYGQDHTFAVQPQMVEGHTVEQDGRIWRLRLRDGLRFHDPTPVLARDCVASIRR
jgi:ABC-type transport system substrate-binding protein